MWKYANPFLIYIQPNLSFNILSFSIWSLQLFKKLGQEQPRKGKVRDKAEN